MNLPSDFMQNLECEVRKLLTHSPRCHDVEHSFRVLTNAKRIAKTENADMQVVEVAALLHDVGRADEFADNGKSCHAEIGAIKVPEILRGLGVKDFIKHVGECVATHRYRRRNDRQPQSLEAKIIFDADKLDSMGAIGIGRSFHFAGRIGAKVHNTEHAAVNSESYSIDDTAYREFLVKLRYLHDSMLTPQGRHMAEKRHRFMIDFFNELNAETQNNEE